MSAALSTPPNGFGHCPNPPAGGRRPYCGRFGDSPAPDSRGLRLPIIFWFENHREHRGHREKWQRSVLSECSVVDYLYKYSFSLKRMHKTTIALPFTQKAIRHPPFIKCGAPNLKVCLRECLTACGRNRISHRL